MEKRMRPERLRNFEQHSCEVRVQVFYSSLSHPKTWGLVTTLYYRVSCTPKQMSTHYCRQQPRWNSCWLHLGSVEQVSHSGSQSWLISLLVVLVPGWNGGPMAPAIYHHNDFQSWFCESYWLGRCALPHSPVCGKSSRGPFFGCEYS